MDNPSLVSGLPTAAVVFALPESFTQCGSKVRALSLPAEAFPILSRGAPGAAGCVCTVCGGVWFVCVGTQTPPVAPPRQGAQFLKLKGLAACYKND